MIASFFQSLERENVSYLLISGQAAVLYGAAVFSEDIDLWVEPTTANLRSLIVALASVSATYYKLTPPVDVPAMLEGHGFHFRLPGEPETYLDVMGRPPRVPGFEEARASALTMDTEWGDIPTIGIRHLAALKSTQRLGDYPVISRLALRYLEGLEAPGADDFRWALDNVHTVDEMEELLREHPAAAEQCEAAPLRRFAAAISRATDAIESSRRDVEPWLADRILALQRADRGYWRPVLAELRELRASGRLMPVGVPVTVGS